MDAVTEGDLRVVAAGDVELVGQPENAPVAVGGGQRRQHAVALRDHDATQLDVLGRDPHQPATDRQRIEPQQLLDGGDQQLRSLAQHGELPRVPQQAQHRQRDLPRRGVEARDQQRARQRDQLVGRERVAVVVRLHQRAEQVIPRLRSFLLDQRRELGEQVVARLQHLRRVERREAEHRVGPRPEPLLPAWRHAEQLADHVHRQRPGQAGDQVRRRPVGRHTIQQRVGVLLHPRAQQFDAAAGERARDELAQPRVLRRVHHHQRGGDRRDRLQPWSIRIGGRRAAEPRVGQQLLVVLVARHQPDVVAAGQQHSRHRIVLAQHGVLGRWLERIRRLEREGQLDLLGRHGLPPRDATTVGCDATAGGWDATAGGWDATAGGWDTATADGWGAAADSWDRAFVMRWDFLSTDHRRR